MPLCVLAAYAASYTFRLHLHVGQVFDTTLRVERQNPVEVGELKQRAEIVSVSDGVITMRVRFAGMTIDGKDRTKDLRAIVGQQAVDIPWTEYSTRTGEMTQLQLKRGDAKVMSFLGEAGLYLCDFVQPAVGVGATWQGSTTATGGCTSGQFTLRQISNQGGRTLAFFDVTDIRMFTSTQIGPMKMTVDLANGLPTYVAYTAQDNKTRRRTKFEQTLAFVKQ